MPQLPATFSAYPVSVVLDGSGNGTILFQAVGSNIRISNISVKVSSSNNQAVATIYRGQVGEQYRDSGTNSGSTGDNISKPIDLFDGEKVYIQWTGGDAGATATATFSGKQLPFDEVGDGDGGAGWNNPIAAGDGSLIYPALKSPNFVTALVGWKVDRNGDAEFNDVVIRGDLIVTGIDGSYVAIERTDGLNLIPYIRLMPPDPGASDNYVSGFIVADESTVSGADKKATLTLGSPAAGGSTSRSAGIILRSEGIVSGDPARVEVTDQLNRNISGDVYPYSYNQFGEEVIAFAAAASATVPVVFPKAFPAGVTPHVFTNIRSGAGVTARWTSRAIAVTNTGFTIFLQKGAAADANTAWTGNEVQWMAFYPG